MLWGDCNVVLCEDGSRTSKSELATSTFGLQTPVLARVVIEWVLVGSANTSSEASKTI